MRRQLAVTLPTDSFLVTFNVETMFTNIPHEGGIEAMLHFLKSVDHASVELTKFILGSNYFMFDSKFYLQKVQSTSHLC